MAIKSNPFQVGYSGEDNWREGTFRCSCCGLPFRRRYNVTAPAETSRVCDDCTEHAPLDGEGLERRVRRAEAHEPALRAAAERAGRNAAELRNELREAKERVASALYSRDAYREILVEVARIHVETSDGCACGAKDCETAAALDARPGYGRRIRGGAAALDLYGEL